MIDPISWEFSWPYILAAFICAYLSGSIPYGLILTRLAGTEDLRAIGSGNIGATNVLRTGNKFIAACTLLLDAAKGAVPVLVAKAWGPDITIIAATGAVIGHIFPVWLMFKGGKGVATGLGVLIALAWPVGLLACATWLVAAALFRYSSLSALLAFALAPVYAWQLADPQRMEFAIGLAVVIWLTHHANIRRLLTGNESRIGKKS